MAAGRCRNSLGLGIGLTRWLLNRITAGAYEPREASRRSITEKASLRVHSLPPASRMIFEGKTGTWKTNVAFQNPDRVRRPIAMEALTWFPRTSSQSAAIAAEDGRIGQKYP